MRRGSPTAARTRSSASAGPIAQVTVFPLPKGTPYANLNTCAFDRDGDLWFTGQAGYVGKLAVRSGQSSEYCQGDLANRYNKHKRYLSRKSIHLNLKCRP